MSLGCKCDSGLSNTGKPNCVTIQSVTSKLILVPLKDSTGAKNYLDLTTTFTEATFTALANQADASKRWFPLPQFENVELAKADSTFEEAPSGRKVFIKQGKRSFAGQLWNETPQLLGKIQDNRCVDFGVYIVDVNGNLVGTKIGTKLYPIPVDNESFEAKLMFATDSATQKIMVGFDFYRLFDESTMWLLTPNDTTDLYDFNNIDGLLDVELTKVSASTTTLVLNGNLSYGTGKSGIAVKGLLLADFSLKNTATGATITLTSVTAVDNVYTLNFASQTASLPVTASVAKTGYVGTLATTLA
jgi:hypothetical protein